jgi:hypothetical protein
MAAKLGHLKLGCGGNMSAVFNRLVDAFVLFQNGQVKQPSTRRIGSYQIGKDW